MKGVFTPASARPLTAATHHHPVATIQSTPLQLRARYTFLHSTRLLSSVSRFYSCSLFHATSHAKLLVFMRVEPSICYTCMHGAEELCVGGMVWWLHGVVVVVVGCGAVSLSRL